VKCEHTSHSFYVPKEQNAMTKETLLVNTVRPFIWFLYLASNRIFQSVFSS